MLINLFSGHVFHLLVNFSWRKQEPGEAVIKIQFNKDFLPTSNIICIIYKNVRKVGQLLEKLEPKIFTQCNTEVA